MSPATCHCKGLFLLAANNDYESMIIPSTENYPFQVTVTVSGMEAIVIGKIIIEHRMHVLL